MSSLPALPTLDELALLGVPAHVAGRVQSYLDALNDADASYTMRGGFVHGGEFDGVYHTGFFCIDPNQTSAGKYLRIVRWDTERKNRDARLGTDDEGTVRVGHGSIHAFLEKATGNVAKPAGWNGPAKSTSKARKGQINWRFSVTDDMTTWPEFDPHGGYLYMRS
jgi:hypothetical protein